MHFANILRSGTYPDRYYVGLADDVDSRLKDHNSGKSSHTSKYPPWQIKSIHGFPDRNKAANFERYLKSGSGRAFAKRHLR
jgi:predicted GIY-YIG superfamily endonuclease